MLLSEMVRRIQNEANLGADTAYAGYSSVHDWTTIKTLTINLPSAQNVLVAFTMRLRSAAGANYALKAGVRCLLDGNPLFGSGMVNVTLAANQTLTYTFFAIVNLSGSHTFTFQTSIAYTGASGYLYCEVGDVYIGTVDFADSIFLNSSASLTVANATTGTVINTNITVPPTRKTCAGAIKKFNVIVLALMWVDDKSISYVKNPGEADASGVNWKILLNDTQVSWTDRRNDYQTDNVTYCEGAYGLYSFQADPSDSLNIKINCYNNSGASQTVKAAIVIIVSPWILGYSEGEVLNLNFPQGSTLYVVTEPLWNDVTKTVKIGKKRARSFGDSSDFYYTASGTGILNASYTFESVDIASCSLFAGGYGGCISIIAVDVR
jgi:hypothetical protein